MSNEVYALKDGVLHILRNSGYFSNCSISLFCIVGYFNRFHKCPEKVDFSKTFATYKDNPDSDVYPEYFDFDESISIPWLYNINMNWHSLFDYRHEPYDMLGPFIKKYFSPSDDVLATAEEFRSKYNIDFDNTLAICYRGTDKHTETGLGSYEVFIDQARLYLSANPGMRIFIQTDQQQFLDACNRELENVFHIEALPMTSTDRAMQHIVKRNEKVEWTQRFLAAIQLIAKCKYVINHSGNVGRWICLYRGNADDMVQYLRPMGIGQDSMHSYWIK